MVTGGPGMIAESKAVRLPRALPLSPHPVTCAESDQGEEQRGPGHGGHGQGVLPSVAPQLSRASPHPLHPLFIA